MEGAIAAAEGGTEGMKVILIFVVLLNIMSAGASDHMITFINALTLMIHLPMLNIIVPANVNLFMSILFPIGTYDLITADISS